MNWREASVQDSSRVVEVNPQNIVVLLQKGSIAYELIECPTAPKHDYEAATQVGLLNISVNLTEFRNHVTLRGG
jgi:hypothetical protein